MLLQRLSRVQPGIAHPLSVAASQAVRRPLQTEPATPPTVLNWHLEPTPGLNQAAAAVAVDPRDPEVVRKAQDILRAYRESIPPEFASPEWPAGMPLSTWIRKLSKPPKPIDPETVSLVPDIELPEEYRPVPHPTWKAPGPYNSYAFKAVVGGDIKAIRDLVRNRDLVARLRPRPVEALAKDLMHRGELQLLEQLIEATPHRHDSLLAKIIVAFLRAGDGRGALRWTERVVREGCATGLLVTHVLTELAGMRLIEGADRIPEAFKPFAESLTPENVDGVRGWVHRGMRRLWKLEQKERFFGLMWSSGFTPNDKDIAYMIFASADISAGLRVTLSNARYYWSLHKRLQLPPSQLLYGCMIYALVHVKEADEALQLYDEMIGLCIRPEPITLTNVLPACRLAGRFERIKELIEEYHTLRGGEHPDAAAYNAAVRSFAAGGRFTGARQMVVAMQRAGHAPNSGTARAILGALAAEHAEARPDLNPAIERVPQHLRKAAEVLMHELQAFEWNDNVPLDDLQWERVMVLLKRLP